MKKIAIVENEASCRDELISYIRRFQKEYNELMEIHTFSDGISFLDEYTLDYDIVLMDIEMPFLNGMDTAKRLREKDPFVRLIFVTMMAQFAVNGYEVGAMDFIVKPVNYFAFSIKLKKAVDGLKQHRRLTVKIQTPSGGILLYGNEIQYIESFKHYCVIHANDQEYRKLCSLQSLDELLSGIGFIRCGKSYLVNPAYITQYEGSRLCLGDKWVPISRAKRKQVIEKLLQYWGEDFWHV